jgi:hypothetical protein
VNSTFDVSYNSEQPKTFNELKAERKADLGSGQCFFQVVIMWVIYQFATHITIGAEVIQKGREDNIILFQSDALLVRSVSFAQTIFQKLKRFAGNDQKFQNPKQGHEVTIQERIMKNFKNPRDLKV